MRIANLAWGWLFWIISSRIFACTRMCNLDPDARQSRKTDDIPLAPTHTFDGMLDWSFGQSLKRMILDGKKDECFNLVFTLWSTSVTEIDKGRHFLRLFNTVEYEEKPCSLVVMSFDHRVINRLTGVCVCWLVVYVCECDENKGTIDGNKRWVFDRKIDDKLNWKERKGFENFLSNKTGLGAEGEFFLNALLLNADFIANAASRSQKTHTLPRSSRWSARPLSSFVHSSIVSFSPPPQPNCIYVTIDIMHPFIKILSGLSSHVRTSSLLKPVDPLSPLIQPFGNIRLKGDVLSFSA